MRLSIGGMEVKPAVWRRAFEESSGYSSDAADDDAAGVALGYVAQVRLGAAQRLDTRSAAGSSRCHARPASASPRTLPHVPAQMVDRLAAYLDVPLRYPLVLCGSRSLVQDSYPPVGSW